MTNTAVFSKHFGLLFLFVGLICSMPAYAGNIKRLSEENITEFIEKTTTMTTAGQTEFSASEVEKHLEKHLDKNARFKSTIRYHIPGGQTQEAALGLDKEEFIKTIQKGDEEMQNYSSEVSIKEINISSNGKTATVITEAYEQGTMPFNPTADVSEEVPLEGQSKCSQVILLNKGVIQMYTAICETDIHFQQY